MVRATVFILLATAASAAKLTAFKNKPKNQKNLLPIGISNEALNLGLVGTCSSFEKVCDTDFCIPTIGTCCGEGNGAFCELGKTCVANGCCPTGQTCTGPPTCEDDDEKICGTFCIPEDADCCDNDVGTFCDAPGTCTSSGCTVGSLRGGSGGGSGGSGGSGGGSSGGSGGSGGGSSSGEQCFSFQEKCGDGCMPDGSVCCASGREYCLSFQVCNNDGTCSRRGGFGGGDDDSDDDDSIFTTSSTTTSTSTNIFGGSSTIPTGLVSGGPDDEEDSSDDSSANSNGSGNNDDDAPRSGDDGNVNQPDAAAVHGPSFLAAAIAFVPLLL